MPWFDDAIFYHIYPLGLCAAPERNDFVSAPAARLERVRGWLDHIQDLGCNALYLGPLFESGTHGYDTADYFHVDRRLGNNETLASLAGELRQRGLRLVLDAVFNHVGRSFWAFRDVQQRGRLSPYASWFSGLSFERGNRSGDPFCYNTWNGHESLVKLNLRSPDVRAHLFKAVEGWIREYQIDGLRLDAADCLDLDFLAELSGRCRALRPDFWLLGELVHGDYWPWLKELNSVTNYECYKGLYSSLNDGNYFEIAYALERQSGEAGIYRESSLYSFVDNHDVDRTASVLKRPEHLYPLYALLLTMPGVPSLYYGSEFGLEGRKNRTDAPLRPALDLEALRAGAPMPDLPSAIRQLARLRADLPALRRGDYRQLHVAHRQLAFQRTLDGQQVVVALNADDAPVQIDINLPGIASASLSDALNPGDSFPIQNGRTQVTLPPHWARVMRVT